jgi:two-component system response regulator YesN
MLTNVLNSIHDYLYSVDADVTSIKFFISDLYLQVKENMSRIYSTMNIPFPSNTLIIANIYTSDYMYQISKFLSDQLEMIMNAIGNSSRESVFDDILYYIEHNHHTNIRLESIASIFE